MQLKIFRKLNLNCNKRYFLILALFILAFVFGKNTIVLTPEQKQLQDKINAQQKIASGIYTVSADQSEQEIKNSPSFSKGNCGRLFFDIKNISLSTDPSDENPKIKIVIKNYFDETQEIGSIELQNNSFIQNKEVDLCSNADYSGLFFQKDKDSQSSSFEVSNISFYSLASGKHDLSNLQSSIIGSTDFSKIIYQSGPDSKDANKAHKFTRNNQKIGQTFVASSDTLSGVDLKMEFTGTGGTGSYFLELREADNSNGKIQLSSDRIAYFQFNKDSAEKDLKAGTGIYHIPLAAHLEMGKTYFIGINNEAVKFNILNTLEIYGSAGSKNEGQAINWVGGKINEESDDLYLKAYGSDYVKIGDQKVLTGARILDNGDGTGLYSYEQKGSFSDYLDLDQFITKNNSSIFYDNAQSGVSAKDENDNAFVYKINTLYPFIKLKVEADQLGGEFTDSLIYYSFDSTTWQEIKDDSIVDNASLQADPNKFDSLISGDGNSKTVYIKITYNKDVAKDKSVQFFGLKNLKINAELKLK